MMSFKLNSYPYLEYNSFNSTHNLLYDLLSVRPSHSTKILFHKLLVL